MGHAVIGILQPRDHKAQGSDHSQDHIAWRRPQAKLEGNLVAGLSQWVRLCVENICELNWIELMPLHHHREGPCELMYLLVPGNQHMAMENPRRWFSHWGGLNWISKRAMSDYQRVHVMSSLLAAELQLPPQPAGRNKFPATRWEQSRLVKWGSNLLHIDLQLSKDILNNNR